MTRWVMVRLALFSKLACAKAETPGRRPGLRGDSGLLLNTMRICMVASSYPRYPGDFAGSFVQALARALVARGHDVGVVAPADPSAVAASEDAIPVRRFSYSPFRSVQPMGYGKALEGDQRLRWSAYACAAPYLLSGLVATRRAVARWQSQLVHAHWVLPNGPMAAAAAHSAGVPMVTTLHGSDLYLALQKRAATLAGRELTARIPVGDFVQSGFAARSACARRSGKQTLAHPVGRRYCALCRGQRPSPARSLGHSPRAASGAGGGPDGGEEGVCPSAARLSAGASELRRRTPDDSAAGVSGRRRAACRPHRR